MPYIDLTHVIYPDMPVYPGTEQPIFEAGTSLEVEGFLEKKISFYSHTGTHMDAPAHIIKGAKKLDELEISTFCGKAICLHVKQQITQEFLKQHEEKFQNVEFVLFASGWDKYWGKAQYFEDFPTLTLEAAEYLCSFNLKGIGLDMISIDKVEDEALPVHQLILGNNMVIIENLKGLSNLPKYFDFYALPLHVKDADGAPVRAMAIF